MCDRPSFAIGFVDVLTGAMSAVLLIFMAQVSQPQKKPEFGGDQAFIRISIDERTAEPRPTLAVRFRVKTGSGKVNGKVLDLAEVRKYEPRLQVIGIEDGSSEITINFKSGAKFEEDEELLVYVHDLNARPRTINVIDSTKPNPIFIRMTVTTKSQTIHRVAEENRDGNPDFLPVLYASTPAMAVKLAEVCGQGKVTKITWRRL